MIANSHQSSSTALPLLNYDNPQQSLLVLKPTSKLPAKDSEGQFAPPSSMSPVSHMGGLKMHVNDMSYKAIVNWITDLGNVLNEGYQTPADLPVDTWIPTQKVLRLKDIPTEWPVGSLVQLFVHPAQPDNGKGSWSREPIAFTQAIITPRRIVNGPLTLLGPDPTELKPGPYRIRTFLDAKGKIHADSSAMLDNSDYQGSLDIQAEWKDGFREAPLHSAETLRTDTEAHER